jgi:hypothetical protein
VRGEVSRRTQSDDKYCSHPGPRSAAALARGCDSLGDAAAARPRAAATPRSTRTRQMRPALPGAMVALRTAFRMRDSARDALVPALAPAQGRLAIRGVKGLSSLCRWPSFEVRRRSRFTAALALSRVHRTRLLLHAQSGPAHFRRPRRESADAARPATASRRRSAAWRRASRQSRTPQSRPTSHG